MDEQGETTDEDVRDPGETMDGDIRDQITREDISLRWIGANPTLSDLRLSTISYWKTGADTPRRPLLVWPLVGLWAALFDRMSFRADKRNGRFVCFETEGLRLWTRSRLQVAPSFQACLLLASGSKTRRLVFTDTADQAGSLVLVSGARQPTREGVITTR